MPSAKRSTPRTPLTQNRKVPPQIIDPVWLIKALALSLVAALICGYATICLLYYQGQWQFILHPSHSVDRTPATAALAYSDLRFDSADTGQPQLTGWWIPAESPTQPDARHAVITILYLHDGSGSLADTVPMLAHLHSAGLNVFAFDYRGFGASDNSVRPSEAHMAEDAAAAFDYLTTTRHIAARTIVPYGAGLGASLAANLAHNHPELPAVILDNPVPDPLSPAIASRSRLIPIRLISGHPFDIAGPISSLTTPKLLLAGGPGSAKAPPDPNSLQSLFRKAASPSQIVSLPSTASEGDYQAAVKQFLVKYLQP